MPRSQGGLLGVQRIRPDLCLWGQIPKALEGQIFETQRSSSFALQIFASDPPRLVDRGGGLFGLAFGACGGLGRPATIGRGPCRDVFKLCTHRLFWI